VESMNIEREYTVFENDIGYRGWKRLQLSEANDFRRTRFT
jgi:hypothetical protein